MIVPFQVTTVYQDLVSDYVPSGFQPTVPEFGDKAVQQPLDKLA